MSLSPAAISSPESPGLSPDELERSTCTSSDGTPKRNDSAGNPRAKRPPGIHSSSLTAAESSRGSLYKLPPSPLTATTPTSSKSEQHPLLVIGQKMDSAPFAPMDEDNTDVTRPTVLAEELPVLNPAALAVQEDSDTEMTLEAPSGEQGSDSASASPNATALESKVAADARASSTAATESDQQTEPTEGTNEASSEPSQPAPKKKRVPLAPESASPKKRRKHSSNPSDKPGKKLKSATKASAEGQPPPSRKVLERDAEAGWSCHVCKAGIPSGARCQTGTINLLTHKRCYACRHRKCDSCSAIVADRKTAVPVNY